METKKNELSEYERYSYELDYYIKEIEKYKSELELLKGTMRNLDAEELDIKKMSQHILESKMEYYTILAKLSRDTEKKKVIKGTKHPKKKRKSDEEKQLGFYASVLDKYYANMVKRVSSHML